MSECTDFKVTHHQKLEDRLSAAKLFASRLGVEETSLLVDSMDDALEHGYEARPERLYAVKGGQVLWRCGLGPFEYDPDGLKRFLETTL
mmetsp:Transcript_46777/g.106071  ORF Transcript_46777/g.106071 Transcript_46777/m.106071 type:complete len:89 (-) Transcript_46777:23-289(-)